MKKNIADLSVWMRQAKELQASGMVREAETIYRKSVEAKPDYAYGWFMLGGLLLKKGKEQEAMQCLAKAAECEPESAGYALKAAEQAWKMGDKELAASLLNQALAADISNEPQAVLAGKLLHKLGRTEEAEALLRKAIAFDANSHVAYNQLGNVLQALGKEEEAMQCYGQAMRLKPGLPQPYLNMGALLKIRKQFAEAERNYLQALALKDDWDTAYEGLTAIYVEQRQWAKAIPVLRKAVKIFDRNTTLWMRLAQVSSLMHQIPNTIGYCKKVLEIDPDHIEANLLLGIKMADMGYQDEAKAYYEKAYAIAPDNANVLHRLGKHHLDHSRFAEGIALVEQALEKIPESCDLFYELIMAKARIADWRTREADEAELLRVLERHIAQEQASGVPILTLCYFNVPPEMHLKAARHTARAHQESAYGVKMPYTPRKAERGRRLRVGYLSPDIRHHAVGELIKHVFQHHDRSQFEVFVYSLVNPQGDEVNALVRQTAEHFRDVQADSFVKIAETIYADGIDVLLDLGGYTSHTKSEVMALRPAPVQIQYIGLLDTTGAPHIDYVLADAHAIPAALAQHYSEQVLHLPSAFPVSEMDESAVAPTTRADWGLPQDAFVFACFNGAYKLSPENFDCWMDILRAVPNSVLWLNYDSEEVVANLRREAEARQVSAERLIFSKRVSLQEHIVRSRHADVFLDTFNFNAGAVAVATLQAGVPLLTLSGHTYSSRVCGSLLKACGLDDLVCSSKEAFVRTALSLATDGERRHRIGQHLRRMRHERLGLFDLEGWVRVLEQQLLAVAS